MEQQITDTIAVNGNMVTESEFQKIEENVNNDKSKKLKEVSEKNFKILDKMNG